MKTLFTQRKLLLLATTLVVIIAAVIVGIRYFYEHKAPISITKPPQTIAENNDLTLIAEPGAPDVVTKAINAAKSSINMTLFELEDRSVESALVAAKQRNVAVRVILNNSKKTNEAAYDELKKHHIDVEWSSSRYHVTHEKSFTVDDQVAYILTYNLKNRAYTLNRDFGLIDQNQADVKAINNVFEADWQKQAINPPSGNDLLWSPGSQPQLLALINNAKQTLIIYNENISSSPIDQALAAAVKRGVDVRLVMTYQPQWQKPFQYLKQAGVKLHLYPDNSHTIYIHAKMLVADNSDIYLGSINFSTTSTDRNRELGAIFQNGQISSVLNTTFNQDYTAAPAY